MTTLLKTLSIGTLIANPVEVFFVLPWGKRAELIAIGDTDSLRAALVDGKTVYVTFGGEKIVEVRREWNWKDEEFRFVLSGKSGEHTLLEAATDEFRLWSHFKGFVYTNINLHYAGKTAA